MYYPTVRDVEHIIKGKEFYGTDTAIMNRGQLEFILDKPRMVLYGKEQYPELYQKAAALMESVCKAHVLGDGNKRAAMAIAQFMIKINGKYLVIPLKSVRLTVDTVMDERDQMAEEIQAWFKIHVADNSIQLRIMLEEIVEEDNVINKLVEQGMYSEAEKIVGKWLAFESYPEYKQQWYERVNAWKQEDDKARSGRYAEWRSLLRVMSTESAHHQSIRIGMTNNLIHAGHSLDESKSRASRIMQKEVELANNVSTKDLWDSVTIFEKFALHEMAIECLDKLFHIDNNIDHVLYHRMNNLFGRSKYEQCLEIGKDLLQRKPDDHGILFTLSLAYYKLKRYSEALAVFNRMPEKYKRQHIREKGLVLSGIGRIEEAEECFEAAYLQDPNDPNNISIKASILAEHERFTEAIELYDVVLKKSPNDAGLMYSKGLALCKTGDLDRGVRCYRDALEINPKYIECMVNIGAYLSNNGNLQESIKYFKTALEINPMHDICLLNTGITLNKMQECGEAIKYLELYRRQKPENNKCLYELAAAYAADGYAEEAVKLLETLLDDPTYAELVKRDERFGSLLDAGKLQSASKRRAANA